MKTLVLKEIRLLFPALVMSLLLALMPIWLNVAVLSLFDLDVLREGSDYTITWMIYPVCFGIFVMALSSFGREYGMATYPLLLALPLERSRIWWAKIAVLAGAMAAVFGAWYFACHEWNENLSGLNQWHIALAFLVIFASGLWTTVLLRQIVSALWFAVLIPTSIYMFITWNRGKVWTVEAALLVYSVAGFWWARRLFYRAEEVAWTGGEVSLPEWRSAGATARFAGRNYRPLAALVWKELRLFQIALAGMAGLFVLHLAAIALRKATHSAVTDFSAFTTAVEEFGVLWLLVPVVTGGLNVADERRMGTMEAHLCLPFSERAQFLVKLCMVLFIGGFLSALLFWIAEHTDRQWLAGNGVFGIRYLVRLGLFRLSLVFMGLSLVMFYASSVARGILQTIIVAVAATIGIGGFWLVLRIVIGILEWWLAWQAYDDLLFELIAWPVVIAAVMWLAYSNFRRLSETRRLFWRNTRGLAGAMLLALAFTMLIHLRVWEFFTPLEPAHGPAKLSLSARPQFEYRDQFTSVLLPDGRLWWNRIEYTPPKTLFTIADNPVAFGSTRLIAAKGRHYANGSNWIQAIECNGQLVGIQSDGTLWSEEGPGKPAPSLDGQPVPTHPRFGRMERFGDAADWKSVATMFETSALLLKTDGTLWRWGTNNSPTSTNLNHYLPYRLGNDSDWSEFFPLEYGAFIWKKDGTAWRFCTPIKGRQKFEIIFGPNLAVERWKSFDNIRWRSVIGGNVYWLGVREDGTLWIISRQGSAAGYPYSVIDNGFGQPVQIGTDRDWVSVTSAFTMVVALKADGTLWKWDWGARAYQDDLQKVYAAAPARLGTHNDWVATDGPCSLPADGSLWCWYTINNPSLLAPSRKPAQFDNIFSDK
jgi:hypothetical protein